MTVWLAAVCLAGASSFGCASQPHENEVEALGGRMRATYSPETARLQQLTYDLDNDGKVDVRAYLEGERLVRAEADENGDGRVDRWEYYVADRQPVRAAAAAAPHALPWSTAVVDRIEMSTRRDGNISRREYYEKGVRVRAEEDTNGDARVDKWETYANGTLSTIGFDLSGKGVPDRRLVYGPDGAPTRLEK